MKSQYKEHFTLRGKFSAVRTTLTEVKRILAQLHNEAKTVLVDVGK